MKIAIVHDWLTVFAGAEQVLAQILQCYPQADLFAVVDFLPKEERSRLLNKPVNTTFIQNLPWAKRYYQKYLPLMPLAIEQLDLSSYDLIISNSHAVAKGVITGPDQRHISYVQSPMRYAWDLQAQYLRESHLERGVKSWLARYLLHRLRLWDVRSSLGVDDYLANSHYIARRIAKVYRRKATVLYPPVNTDAFSLVTDKEDYYVAASRLVPYKKMDRIVSAFAAMPERKLVVIGNGTDFAKLKRLTTPNIQLLGYQPTEALISYLQKAKAFIFAAEEDFGILPVEAQACGTPVIAYAKGGACETVLGLESATPTGVFFKEQSSEAIRQAVLQFEQHQALITPLACRKNALRFSEQRFREELMRYVACASISCNVELT